MPADITTTIPRMHDMDGSFYRTNTMNAGAPMVDIGGVYDVFDRAGVPIIGIKRKAFAAAAAGKVVIRVGMNFCSLTRADFDTITKRLPSRKNLGNTYEARQVLPALRYPFRGNRVPAGDLRSRWLRTRCRHAQRVLRRAPARLVPA